MQAQDLRVEISGGDEERGRIQGQLVDLPVVIDALRRPEATVEELIDGGADLCVFIRLSVSGENTELRLGLIDRRANRRLVERRLLQEDERSVALELAALTVREWVSDVLRGGELGVSMSPARAEPPAESPPAPTPPVRAPPQPVSSPSRGWFHVEAGWLVGIDGSGRPTHGLSLGLGFGRRTWSTQLVSAFGLASRWALPSATIERSHLTLLWAFEGIARFGVFSVRGGLRTGPAWSWRRTLSVREGLQPAGRETVFSWVAGASGTVAATVGPVVLMLRAGAEVWLRRPSYRIASETTSPWPLRPVASLAVRYRWPHLSNDRPADLTALGPTSPLYW